MNFKLKAFYNKFISSSSSISTSSVLLKKCDRICICQLFGYNVVSTDINVKRIDETIKNHETSY